MPNIYNLPFPKNYVYIIASKPNLYSASFYNIIDFPPYSANLKPLLLRILVK